MSDPLTHKLPSETPTTKRSPRDNRSADRLLPEQNHIFTVGQLSTGYVSDAADAKSCDMRKLLESGWVFRRVLPILAGSSDLKTVTRM
jgi:hypothetical protein